MNHRPHGHLSYPAPVGGSPWSYANSHSNGHQESAEQAAASALLIAAGGPRKSEVERMKQQQQQQQSNPGPVTTPCTPSAQAPVSQVSPHSHSPSQRDGTSSVTSATNQPLVISDFPAKLHRVLTQSEYAGKVLEWLPTGTSWRVLRWNELSKSVIPTHFPELVQDDSEAGGEKDAEGEAKEEVVTSARMNRFLYQIQVHGFQEIRDVGPDMGAYRHEVRRKILGTFMDFPSFRNICREMSTIYFHSIGFSPNNFFFSFDSFSSR